MRRVYVIEESARMRGATWCPVDSAMTLWRAREVARTWRTKLDDDRLYKYRIREYVPAGAS